MWVKKFGGVGGVGVGWWHSVSEGWGDPGVGGGGNYDTMLWTAHDQVVSEEILNSYYVWYS